MITQLLEDLGYSANEAKIIKYLLKNSEVSQRDIERTCDINQPGVSLALRSLQKMNIIRCTKTRLNEKAKAGKVYTLKPHAITEGPEEQIKAEYERKMKLFAALKHDNI